MIELMVQFNPLEVELTVMNRGEELVQIYGFLIDPRNRIMNGEWRIWTRC